MIINEFKNSTVFSYQNMIEYAVGNVVSRQVIQRKTGNVTLFSFDKDQKLSEHSAPFDALIQIID
jgi:quercetin dioxygenase-like cupin family protein